jgi:hypothetical protein
MQWGPEEPDVVFLCGQDFGGELEGITKAEKYESDSRFIHYTKQDFMGEFMRPLSKWQLSLLDLPVSTSEKVPPLH